MTRRWRRWQDGRDGREWEIRIDVDGNGGVAQELTGGSAPQRVICFACDAESLRAGYDREKWEDELSDRELQSLLDEARKAASF